MRKQNVEYDRWRICLRAYVWMGVGCVCVCVDGSVVVGCKSYTVSSAKPGILYGLPKTHKEATPMRPILSAIGTFNYKLAKFLGPILQPIATNEHTIHSCQMFAKEVKQLQTEFLNHR